VTQTLDTFATLRNLSVADAMHPGLVACPVDTPLRTVARMMATYRVHAILVVARGAGELPDGGHWGIVTDVDVMQAGRANDFAEQPVQEIVAQSIPSVETGQPLADAAELMMDEGVSHLIVVDPGSGRPIGVLSTLDIARALADFPERHPIRS
jgi:CBS domain-containing protein